MEKDNVLVIFILKGFGVLFWCIIKYEEVYLKTYNSIMDAGKAMIHYITWYNNHRPHQELGYKTL